MDVEAGHHVARKVNVERVLGAEGAAAERAASRPRVDALRRFARENVARGRCRLRGCDRSRHVCAARAHAVRPQGAAAARGRAEKERTLFRRADGWLLRGVAVVAARGLHAAAILCRGCAPPRRRLLRLALARCGRPVRALPRGCHPPSARARLCAGVTAHLQRQLFVAARHARGVGAGLIPVRALGNLHRLPRGFALARLERCSAQRGRAAQGQRPSPHPPLATRSSLPANPARRPSSAAPRPAAPHGRAAVTSPCALRKAPRFFESKPHERQQGLQWSTSSEWPEGRWRRRRCSGSATCSSSRSTYGTGGYRWTCGSSSGRASRRGTSRRAERSPVLTPAVVALPCRDRHGASVRPAPARMHPQRTCGVAHACLARIPVVAACAPRQGARQRPSTAPQRCANTTHTAMMLHALGARRRAAAPQRCANTTHTAMMLHALGARRRAARTWRACRPPAPAPRAPAPVRAARRHAPRAILLLLPLRARVGRGGG